ncbi:hypothetical protein [Klebsiella pneumoniae]|uniref:phage baseplate plug family protein n=1 Tax=Klebsiella pneumoniae TaxID=573 RepID=UPI001252AF70|nr:hypothetical protein [Klebsiella pneumoniae]VAP72408.1 Uncharacterised protein [Klebsiella pneumoniae]HBW3346578.1 hypothetical protein [Klebsiella pneumoniae]
MKKIPLDKIPAQNINVVLSQQNCDISVYQKSGLVYVDLSVSGKKIISASLARDRVKLIRGKYLGFNGDLMFVDTQGYSDPQYTGFNQRWILVYVEAGE